MTVLYGAGELSSASVLLVLAAWEVRLSGWAAGVIPRKSRQAGAPGWGGTSGSTSADRPSPGCGGSFTTFALPLLVFRLTHSATNLALATVAEFVPYLLFGLLGRRGRRPVRPQASHAGQ